jgi:hypothetical protein
MSCSTCAPPVSSCRCQVFWRMPGQAASARSEIETFCGWGVQLGRLGCALDFPAAVPLPTRHIVPQLCEGCVFVTCCTKERGGLWLHDPAEDLGDGIFIEQSLPVRVAADQAGRQTATDGRERVYTPGHATIFFFCAGFMATRGGAGGHIRVARGLHRVDLDQLVLVQERSNWIAPCWTYVHQRN